MCAYFLEKRVLGWRIACVCGYRDWVFQYPRPCLLSSVSITPWIRVACDTCWSSPLLFLLLVSVQYMHCSYNPAPIRGVPCLSSMELRASSSLNSLHTKDSVRPILESKSQIIAVFLAFVVVTSLYSGCGRIKYVFIHSNAPLLMLGMAESVVSMLILTLGTHAQ